MTEREYVEHIHRVATEYLRIIDAPDGARGLLDSSEARAWQRCTEVLSPFTMIDMCNAWLVASQNSDSASMTGEIDK